MEVGFSSNQDIIAHCKNRTDWQVSESQIPMTSRLWVGHCVYTWRLNAELTVTCESSWASVLIYFS